MQSLLWIAAISLHVNKFQVHLCDSNGLNIWTHFYIDWIIAHELHSENPSRTFLSSNLPRWELKREKDRSMGMQTHHSRKWSRWIIPLKTYPLVYGTKSLVSSLSIWLLVLILPSALKQLNFSFDNHFQ